MDAPRIALRFRDLTPGVDTIVEHRQVAHKVGSVWWGWWKKHFENDHSTLLKELYRQVSRQHPLELILVDTSTQRCFSATATEVAPRISDGQLKRVPRYYRHMAPDIPAWFRLNRIDDTGFDPRLEAIFGDATFVDLAESRV